MKIVNGVVITDFKKTDNKNEISKIVHNTENTWQKNRTDFEKKADTRIGKEAEDVFEKVLKELSINNYHTYDSIRTDDFKFHAPFDGFFCNELTEDIKNCINNGVLEFGPKLNAKIRNQLRTMRVKTVEIKSTRLADKYKNKANFHDYCNYDELVRLIDELLKLDFLTYPYYTRVGFYDNFLNYCLHFEKQIKTGLPRDKLIEHFKKNEIENSSDIFVRIFMDEKTNKSLLLRWIDSDKFFENPTPSKLFKKQKSNNALYFLKPLKSGKPIAELSEVLKI